MTQLLLLIIYKAKWYVLFTVATPLFAFSHFTMDYNNGIFDNFEFGPQTSFFFCTIELELEPNYFFFLSGLNCKTSE